MHGGPTLGSMGHSYRNTGNKNEIVLDNSIHSIDNKSIGSESRPRAPNQDQIDLQALRERRREEEILKRVNEEIRHAKEQEKKRKEEEVRRRLEEEKKNMIMIEKLLAEDAEEEEIRKMTTQENCAVCFLEKRNVVFLPCGHICACKTCAEEWMRKKGGHMKCFVCGAKVEKITQVYFS